MSARLWTNLWIAVGIWALLLLAAGLMAPEGEQEPAEIRQGELEGDPRF